MGKTNGLRIIRLAVLQQPSPRSEPNQNFLQIVQTGINNQHEHNGQSNDAHGPFDRRALQNHSQVGKRFFELAPPQRLSSGEAASPNPTSTGSEFTHSNKRRSVWHAPLQECVLRAGTTSLARSQRPQLDLRRNHSLEKNGILPSTNGPGNQHPGRNLGTFSRTNAGLRRSKRNSSRSYNSTKTRRRATECITGTMDQLELVDQIKAGHNLRTPSQNKRTGEGERPPKRPNKTKPDPEEVCTRKESHLHIMERPSKILFHGCTRCQHMWKVSCFWRH